MKKCSNKRARKQYEGEIVASKECGDREAAPRVPVIQDE